MGQETLFQKVKRLERSVAEVKVGLGSLATVVMNQNLAVGGLSSKLDQLLAGQAEIITNQERELELLEKIVEAVTPPTPGTIQTQQIIFSAAS